MAKKKKGLFAKHCKTHHGPKGGSFHMKRNKGGHGGSHKVYD